MGIESLGPVTPEDIREPYFPAVEPPINAGWLHRPMLQNVKKVLANPEPSTHDPTVWTGKSIFASARLRFTWNGARLKLTRVRGA
jgi:hypothetical protein